jgi:ElaA protein
MSRESPLQWSWFDFESLSGSLLYECLQLRSKVFVVEQKCIFQDLDGADKLAKHLLGIHTTPEGVSKVAAYARCFSPTSSHIHTRVKPESNIGRILVSEEFRGRGFGKALVQEAIRYLVTEHPSVPIRIGAQIYLQKFYGSETDGIGFVNDGEPYDEDGIPHIDMLYTRHLLVPSP